MEHIVDDIIKNIYYIPVVEYKNEGGVVTGMTYHFYAELSLNKQCNYLKEVGTLFEGIGVKRRELWRDLMNSYGEVLSDLLLDPEKNYKLRQSRTECLTNCRILADSEITKKSKEHSGTCTGYGIIALQWDVENCLYNVIDMEMYSRNQNAQKWYKDISWELW